MTATTDTRKRTREDDGSDSVPLSKRINNLHINNNINIPNNHILPHNSHENGIVNNSNGNYPPQLENVDSSADGQHHHHHQSPGDHFYHNNGDESNSAITQQYHASPEFGGEHYNPELNQHENPYYYSKNKLLYELHIERLRRAQN